MNHEAPGCGIVARHIWSCLKIGTRHGGYTTQVWYRGFLKWGYPKKIICFRLGFSTLKHPAIGVPPWLWKPPEKKKQLPRGPDVAWRAWKRTIRCWTDGPRWGATAATRCAASCRTPNSWAFHGYFPVNDGCEILHQLIGGLSMFIPLRLWIFIGFQPSKVKDFAIFRNHPLMLNQWWMDLG